MQDYLRACIAALWWPERRFLRVLDLPDELLLTIFEFAGGDGDDGGDKDDDNGDDDGDQPARRPSTASPRTIQSIRLVCRRFCVVGSQLLLRCVDVYPDEQSLARLDQISRHPAIARGVRAVRIMHFLQGPEYSQHGWHGVALANPADPVGRRLPGPAQVASALLSWAHQNLHAGDNGGDSDRDSARRLVNRGALLHQEYMAVREAEEALVRSGRFVRSVAAAFARMTGARRLTFSNGADAVPRSRLRPNYQGTTALARTLVWADLHQDVRDPTRRNPSDYVHVLAVVEALRGAGVTLRALHFDGLVALGQPGNLVPDPLFRESFSSGMRWLQVLALVRGGLPFLAGAGPPFSRA